MKKEKTVTYSTWYEKKSKRKFQGEVQDSKSEIDTEDKSFEKKSDEKSAYPKSTRHSKSDGHFKSTSRTNKSGMLKNSEEKTDSHRKRQSKRNYSSAPKEIYAKDLGRLFDSSSIPKDAKKILSDFQLIINSTHPLNSKQRALLPEQIRELSHGLTDQRGERRLGYMNQPTTLSSYVHYFLWWNLFRLTKLFSNLPSDFLDLTEDDICLDIGSGPLTVPIALYLSRPELRNKKIKWYCMDISSQALSIGENLLMTISTKLVGEMWEIVRVKGNFGTDIKEKATFVSCANIFNEVVEDKSMPPDYQAKKCTEGILPYVDSKKENTKVLLIEPGVPSSARLLSLMRDSFMRKGFNPVSPCQHCDICPMDGKKGGKWCNFAFSTEDAPQGLKHLSEKAGLPKDRAVLSFVALKKSATPEIDLESLEFRIASDPIRLPGKRTGYYACSRLGLLLIKTSANLCYGDGLSVESPRRELNVDEKSGAYILELD